MEGVHFLLCDADCTEGVPENNSVTTKQIQMTGNEIICSSRGPDGSVNNYERAPDIEGHDEQIHTQYFSLGTW